MTDLFSPFTAGKLFLKNRIVMAPLTRNRAGAGEVPRDIAAVYYGQRASAGLIITEGSQPSAVGQGYLHTPGLHTDAQIEGWRAIADAVHDSDGQVVAQIMHAGRISHPDNKNGLEVVAPSALAAPGEVLTPSGQQAYPVPHELTLAELPAVIAEYADASRRTVEAGLDGVELHAANGYLLHQFLSPASNVRTDSYGGSPQARARFVVETVRAAVDAIGADRVGIRISPGHNIQGALETDTDDLAATYGYLIDQIAPLGLAYLHILGDPRSALVQDLRARFGGAFIANSGFSTVTSKAEAQEILDEGLAEMVAVGRLFIANPDLPRRWHSDAELNEPNPETFYGGDGEGYIDYPALAD